MHGRLPLIVLLLCLLFAPTSSLPQNHALPPPVGGITFEQVIRLSQSGLSDGVIIAQIKMRPQPFSLSPDELLQLKAAHVSNNVIEAMVGTPAPPEQSGRQGMAGYPAEPAETISKTDLDDPLAEHEPGIYVYYVTSSGKRELLKLEPTVYGAGNGGGFFKYSSKAVLRSAHAAISIPDPNLVFYFHSEKTLKDTTLGRTDFSGAPSSPHEFTLLHLQVKDNNRETRIWSWGYFGGSRSGAEDKNVVPFTFKMERPGIYKVTLNAPLNPGEYCFLSGMYGVQDFRLWNH
jgi:hypothetical protein